MTKPKRKYTRKIEPVQTVQPPCIPEKRKYTRRTVDSPQEKTILTDSKTKPPKFVPLNLISNKAKNIVDWKKTETETKETGNPWNPKHFEAIKKKYCLTSENPLMQLQQDNLAKLKALMDQAYCVNDIKAYSQACQQATNIIGALLTLSDVTAQDTFDFEKQVLDFEKRIRAMKGKPLDAADIEKKHAKILDKLENEEPKEVQTTDTDELSKALDG